MGGGHGSREFNPTSFVLFFTQVAAAPTSCAALCLSEDSQTLATRRVSNGFRRRRATEGSPLACLLSARRMCGSCAGGSDGAASRSGSVIFCDVQFSGTYNYISFTLKK